MRKRMLILCTALIIGVPLSGATAADQAPAGILYTQPLKSVIFSHQDHLRKGDSCNTCHGGLFEMKTLRAQTRKDFNMYSLYKGKYCAPATPAGRPLPRIRSARAATWEPAPV